MREYATVRSPPIIRGSAKDMEKAIVDEIRITSLIRLIEGGTAILKAEKINHQNVNKGKKLINPFIRRRFRDANIL